MKKRFGQTICSRKPWLKEIGVVCQRDLLDPRMTLRKWKGGYPKDCGSHIVLVIIMSQFEQATYNGDQAPEKRAPWFNQGEAERIPPGLTKPGSF